MTTVLQPRTPVRAYRIGRTQSVVIMDPVRPAARSHGPAPRLGHSHQGLDHAGARLLHQRPIRPNRPYPDRPSPLRHPWIAHFCAPMFVFLAGAQRLNDGHDPRELPLARDTRLQCCCPSPGVRHPSRHPALDRPRASVTGEPRARVATLVLATLVLQRFHGPAWMSVQVPLHWNAWGKPGNAWGKPARLVRMEAHNLSLHCAQ